MVLNTLQGCFDDLREQFRSMDNIDLSKEERLNVFRQTQQTLKSIDHLVSYAKGTDTVNFGFSSILHMSTLPPLEKEQRSVYQAEMNSFFVEIFQNLDEETIQNILKGKFEIRDKQVVEARLPQLSENQNHEPSEHEAEVYKVSDAEIQRQIDKVRKIFPRMDSEAQAEAESSYKQCFATIQKVNEMAHDSDEVGEFNISFSKILEESHFEARLFANIKELNVGGIANSDAPDVSTSTAVRVLPQNGIRSLAAIATTYQAPPEALASETASSDLSGIDVYQNLVEWHEGVHCGVSNTFGSSVANASANSSSSGGIKAIFNKSATRGDREPEYISPTPDF